MSTRYGLSVLTLILVAGALVLAPAARAADEDTPPPAPAGAPADATPPAGATPPADATPPVPLDERVVEDAVMEELEVPEESVEELGEVVVTATRAPALRFYVPRSVNVVKKRRIFERGSLSSIDALDDEVGIWVEKRTAHTSDPVIRGLSGTNILALVDGNTLSTFWGEGGFAGDDMYGKIDPGAIDHIEVVRGPSSVLYGSNALGAVINFIMKESPLDYTPYGMCWGGRTFALAGTDTSGWRVRQEGWGASRRFRWFAGVTYIDWGSTRDGGGQVQTPTSARGWYSDIALNYKISDCADAKFTFQYTGLDPVYRYYRPTQDNENLRLAFAGWLTLHDLSRRVGFADEVKLALYFQNKEDTRRWYDAAGNQTRWGIAKWRTAQVDLQAEKQLCNHALTYGIEFESTWGESPDDEQFTIHYPTGVIDKPAPDSVWSSLGGYVQDVWEITPRFTVTGSLRVDGLRLATEVDQYYNPPGGLDPSVDEFTDYQLALAGGLQGTWKMTDTTNVYGGWTRGFRQFAPVFGVTQHAGFGVVVPNQFLDPVTADQFELGLKHRSENWDAGLVGYYTYFNNFQNVVPGTFLGSDWYDYNGNGVRDPDETVYVNVGNGTADLYGVEAWAEMNLAALGCRFFRRAWTVAANFTYNYGQDAENDVPMRHTQPMAAMVRLRWEPHCNPCRRPWAEIQGRFVDRFDRIPPDRLANDVGYYEDPQDAASGMRRTWGLPGYSVWDFRAGYILNERVEFVVGVGNIFDKLYRPAHARWDAPGRNVYGSISITF